MTALLEVKDLSVSYGKVSALDRVSIKALPNTVVAVLGTNGAGKSTLLRAISSLKSPSHGEVLMDGQRLDKQKPHEVVAKGVCHVPEGRELFSGMSVYENLRLGAFRMPRNRVPESLARIYELFPILKDRRSQAAGTLSGGEQQMLAIARALMSEPKIMLFDEPSLGLAPQLRDEVLAVIRRLHEVDHLTIILVEQEVESALEISSYAYVLEGGNVVAEGESAEMLQRRDMLEMYLGNPGES